MPSDQGAPDWWDDIEKAERADLMVESDAQREYFKLKRQRWDGEKGVWVDIQDPPWNKKKEILSDCIEAREDGSGDLDLSRYYREMLDYMLVDASFDFKNSASLLRGLNNESGDKLESLVPRPSARGITEGEEGKSDEPSEDESSTTTAE